jgi:Phosphodiester glycosidase
MIGITNKCAARFGFTVIAMLAAALLSAHAADMHLFTNQPLPGIVIRGETRTNPPTRLFIAEIDLTNPNVHLHVASGGPDPDGQGPWQTVLMQPTRVAARENFDLVVNGDFFQARGVVDAEGADSQYRSNIWARVEGPAVSSGKVWSTSIGKLPCLVVHRTHSVTIEMLSRPTADDLEVIAGNTLVLSHGANVSHLNPLRHPRTVVGLNAGRTKLVILVVDGRKAGVALGMSYAELGTEMQRLGCTQAINLDGGGSTVMAVRDLATGKYRVLNDPTDGQERAVANVLGISIDRN